MLIGRKHKFIMALVPLKEAVDVLVKKSFDLVRQPDTFQAIANRDDALKVQQEIDNLVIKIETRKWKKQ